ncbi:hypothetical protein [Planctomicrobium piriforme]|uniref:DUF2157 domain-containing protein n=1 Tax=Planctomicrobium piriforme TaxID=1576369 RepID=A0A1I3K7K3_9PLAN|nr:hypothetical protein [Planctomicrobium piriforme]SFI68476.1 hypothetical protein SAMN05421753_111143 [Planctomicrobium piriforme]
MSSQLNERAWFLRFCDAFFQEQNIKWLLGIGMLILLGSSSMLVSTHWETAPPLWKAAVLFGYTFALYFTGRFCYFRLGLQKTGTGLMALTVLLIPIAFLALRWIHPDGLLTLNGLVSRAGLLTLLAASGIASTVAAWQVFHHFLRRTTWPFLLSYLALAFSGAMVPALPANVAPLAACLLWGVYAIGAIDAARHVFWLTEEHRLPRICGFFPVLLLGGQFLMLFCSSLLPHVPTEWLGFGLVLTAIPVLISVNELAKVIERRTGAVGPLPVGLAIPLVVGLCATLAGVCLSASGYPGTFALVPTSVLAAVVMGLMARRTSHVGFVWATLLLVMMAYQTSPVFFKELARAAVQTGAAAVHEQRLPLAFYGLTYLPLLALATALASATPLRRSELWAKPLQQFAIGLQTLLLLAACTHPKATFPVGIALAVMFGMQLALFKKPQLLQFAVAAFLTAGWGATSFLYGVLQVPITPELPTLAWLIAGGLLLVPGIWIDRIVHRLRNTERPDLEPVCQLTSLAVCLVSGGILLASAVVHPVAFWAGCLCSVLLLVHAFERRHPLIGVVSLAFPVVFAVVLAWQAYWSLEGIVTLATILFALVSLLGRSLEFMPATRLSLAFAEPARIVAIIGLLLVELLLIPAMCLVSIGANIAVFPAAVIALLGLLELAWSRNSASLTTVAWLSTLSLAAATWTTLRLDPSPVQWLPTVIAAVPLLLSPVLRRFAPTEIAVTQSGTGRFWNALDWCATATLLVIALLSIQFLSNPFRAAGFIGIVGLLGLSVGRGSSQFVSFVLALANGLLLTTVLHCFVPEVTTLTAMSWRLYAPAALGVAFVSGLCALLWEGHRERHSDASEEMIVGLWGLSLGSLVCDLLQNPPGSVQWQIALVTGTCLALAAQQIWQACHQAQQAMTPEDTKKAERRVWLAEGVMVLGFADLILANAISITGELALFLPFIAAVIAWGMSRVCAASKMLTVVSRPLQQTAMALPTVTVLLGVLRHLSVAHPHWLGANSLALLLAAAFYFWRGLEDRRTPQLIGSALILNVALALLWRELHWSDPQLFLIPLGLSVLWLTELLGNRIPVSYHDPLRYAGALTILISPTFHIVGGSWLHLLTLMVASVVIVLLAIGLRVRALMYTGTAFLIADIAAMVVRGSLDEPHRLWLAGIVVGAAVIALAAYCERHREQMLQQMRLMASRLEAWR